MKATRAIGLVASALGLMACADADNWGPDELASGKSVQTQERLDRGRELYSTYCVGCHGEQGDGEGPAAKFLSPKPRDFRKGRLKFASVAANDTPSDDDYARVIQHGLHGTSMPTWALLPKQEIYDIVGYVRTFAPQKKAPGATVAIPQDPWASKPEKGVEEGERVYHGIASCNNCHPSYTTMPKIAEHMKAFDIAVSSFRPNMYDSETKDSDWGAPIRPPDFLVDPVKNGSAKGELVRTIATGVGGTAMPSWGGTLTPKQLWGLAYYVEHLAAMRGSPEAKALRQELLSQPKFEPPPPPPAPPPTEATAAPDASGAPAASGKPDAGAKPDGSAKPSATAKP